MKTKITESICNWISVKNACRTTVNKDATGKKATEIFKRKLLISEHSPIRKIRISWLWDGIKSWIATHYSRHKWECFISTQRSDRTGINRDDLPQGQQVKFEGEANAQHLIDTARKRLCQASHRETRELMEDLKHSLHDSGEFALADVLVPNCIYRCGCPEFNPCWHWTSFLKYTNENDIDITNIQERYDLYNRHFYGD